MVDEVIQEKYSEGEVRVKIRSSVSDDPNCFDYEELELNLAVNEGEDPVEKLRDTKARVLTCCTRTPGSPLKAATVQPQAHQGGGGGYSNKVVPDWNSMYGKWNLPFKTPAGAAWSAAQAKDYLKANGARFRGKKFYPGDPDADNCWYTDHPIPRTEFLSAYFTPINAPAVEDDDDIPF